MSRIWALLGIGLGLAVSPQAHSQGGKESIDGGYIVSVTGFAGRAQVDGKVFIHGDFALILVGENRGAIFAVETVGKNVHLSPIIQTARIVGKEVSGNMLALGDRSFNVALSGNVIGDSLTLEGTGMIRADYNDKPRKDAGIDVFPRSLKLEGSRSHRYEWRDVWEKSFAFDNVEGELSVQARDPKTPNEGAGNLKTCKGTLRLQSVFGGMAILRKSVGNLTTGAGEDIEKKIEGVLFNTYYTAAFLGVSRYYLYRLDLPVNGVGWFTVEQYLED